MAKLAAGNLRRHEDGDGHRIGLGASGTSPHMTKHTSNLAYESSSERLAKLPSTGGHQVSPDLNGALAALLLEVEHAVRRLGELTKEADSTSWNQTKRKKDVTRELTAQRGCRGAPASAISSSYPTKAAIVRLIAAGRASGLDVCGYEAGPDGFIRIMDARMAQSNITEFDRWKDRL